MILVSRSPGRPGCMALNVNIVNFSEFRAMLAHSVREAEDAPWREKKRFLPEGRGCLTI